MQETKTRAPADEEPPAPRPSWIRIVAIAVALAMLGGVLYATWQTVASSGSDPEANGNPGVGVSEPDFSLTDEEAIERFKELNERRVRAYESTDVTLVNRFAGPGPFRDQVLDELRQLKKDRVTAKPIFETEYLDVTSNSSTRITLEQAVIFDLRFFDESGNDVTTEGKPERLVVEWTLAYFDEGWLLTESIASEAGPAD
ncbi:MAG: hypothetical protein ACRDK3_11590 [Actinomycetota bacterium]